MNFLKLFVVCMFSIISQLAVADDGVSRSAFTSSIQEREPVDQIVEFENDQSKIFFFTEIKGMQGYTITHRWQYGGEKQAEVSFKINANRWRVWSSKNLISTRLGEWQVQVLDEGGNLLSQESFQYIEKKQ